MAVNDGTRDRSITLASYQPPIRDFAVEAEIQRTDNNQGLISFALLTRGDGSRGYWAGFHTGAGRTPHVALEAGVPGDASSLALHAFDPGGDWHLYRIEASGIRIRMFIDGALMLDVTNAQYSAGTQTGLWSWGARINVRNYRITTL